MKLIYFVSIALLSLFSVVSVSAQQTQPPNAGPPAHYTFVCHDEQDGGPLQPRLRPEGKLGQGDILAPPEGCNPAIPAPTIAPTSTPVVVAASTATPTASSTDVPAVAEPTPTVEAVSVQSLLVPTPTPEGDCVWLDDEGNPLADARGNPLPCHIVDSPAQMPVKPVE